MTSAGPRGEMRQRHLTEMSITLRPADTMRWEIAGGLSDQTCRQGRPYYNGRILPTMNLLNLPLPSSLLALCKMARTAVGVAPRTLAAAAATYSG